MEALQVAVEQEMGQIVQLMHSHAAKMHLHTQEFRAAGRLNVGSSLTAGWVMCNSHLSFPP